MTTISLDTAVEDFGQVVSRVLADAEPTIVNTPSGGRVIILPFDDFAGWQETAYLLRNPANAAHLQRSIAEAEGGKAVVRELAE